MFRLDGRRILLTGASGGIGETVAKTLASLGAEVCLSGTRLEKLQKIVEENPSFKFHSLPCSLSVPEEVLKLVPQAEEKMGGLDILVNNAGVTRDGLAVRMKDEDWNTVIEINLNATFKLSRAALKPMMKQRFGRIITITSVVGVIGNAGQANYCASKAGLMGLSKALAAEVASRQITVNCVAPGFIETPMTDQLSEAQKESIFAMIPAGYLGKPEDVAAAVAFLSSNEAAYITGQTLHVNGGMARI